MKTQYRLTSTSELVLPTALDELYELLARLVQDYNSQLYVNNAQTKMITDIEIRLLQLKYAPGVNRVVRHAMQHEDFDDYHEGKRQEIITHCLWWTALKEELKELGMWIRMPDEND